MPRPTLTSALILAMTLSGALSGAPFGGAVRAGTTAAPAADAGLPDSPGGAYLAARLAASTHDFAAAAHWFEVALQFDPQNPGLLEGGATARLALGDTEGAQKMALALTATGAKSQIAAMAELAVKAQKGDFAGILADQAAGASVGELMDNLVTAWAEVGTGKMSDATVAFDAILAKPGMRPFGLYHKALALAQTGDFEGAEKLLTGPEADAIMGLRRGVLAQVQILTQLERGPEAVALLDQVYGTVLDDGLADLRRRAAAGEAIPFDVARTPQEGLAEAFFTLATVLADQADDTFTLLNVRLATALRPDHVEAQLMAARVLDKLEQYDLAVVAYGKVPEGDAAYVSAAVGQATAAISAGRVDDAVAMLKVLAESHPKDPGVLTAYGDTLRRQDHCDAAIGVYSQAIALIATPGAGDWSLYYRRGTCAFADGDWPAAEADYKTALTLAPNEPRLLNELGYGYVDRGENLDAALAMIQKAVAAAPDQGFIIDSLAWAYFRMGRYAEAVAPQEKASLLMPNDPVVTDHLGDVYWMAGRKREAQYQWHRALSFGPSEKDALRIRQKIDLGLDAVLLQEKTQGSNGG